MGTKIRQNKKRDKCRGSMGTCVQKGRDAEGKEGKNGGRKETSKRGSDKRRIKGQKNREKEREREGWGGDHELTKRLFHSGVQS